ncbi:MAG: micrococcal nuclease [Lysobacterales bacterium]|jgi:micrococcal nuclease
MPKPPATAVLYEQLIITIRDVLSEGIVEAQRRVDYERLRAYWGIGRVIEQTVKASNGDLDLDEALYNRISEDVKRHLNLDMSLDTIRRTIQFSREYTVFPKNTPLTFTHYLSLMRVHDKRRRISLERKDIKEEMSAMVLKQKVVEIIHDNKPLDTSKKNNLILKRGEPYVYYVQSYKDIKGKESNWIDCGFKINLNLNDARCSSNIKRYVDGRRIIAVTKTNNVFCIKETRLKKNLEHTYKASVIRVVDGDTIDVLIDVGFNIITHQRLRLKGINTPEITTATGRRAMIFLTEYLSKNPLIIIRTHKSGMYGRWLADIFTKEGSDDPYLIARKGVYLNQLLLDEGYAEIY